VVATGPVTLDRLTKVTLERKGKKEKSANYVEYNLFSSTVPRTGKSFPEPPAP
jgi:hypothetical protein